MHGSLSGAYTKPRQLLSRVKTHIAVRHSAAAGLIWARSDLQPAPLLARRCGRGMAIQHPTRDDPTPKRIFLAPNPGLALLGPPPSCCSCELVAAGPREGPRRPPDSARFWGVQCSAGPARKALVRASRACHSCGDAPEALNIYLAAQHGPGGAAGTAAAGGPVACGWVAAPTHLHAPHCIAPKSTDVGRARPQGLQERPPACRPGGGGELLCLYLSGPLLLGFEVVCEW